MVVADPAGCISAQQLEDEHGASIRHLATDYPTPYKLCKVLREREPPLYISDGVAKQWLERFGGQADLRYIRNAGHLEAQWGQSIRDHVAHVGSVSSAGIAEWLFMEHKVSVPQRICKTWLQRDWSSSGALYTREAVEEALGDRLRLNQYKECFASEESAHSLSEVLSESQPPHVVSGSVLRHGLLVHQYKSRLPDKEASYLLQWLVLTQHHYVRIQKGIYKRVVL